ncbi:chlorite dismutase [Sinomonas cellulolyticus]|jgi:chlorite dismutase|uniref:Coproheme decarboxylase n=1 Tax=Sinomonas cellulolyticus TaxID=2801916 RepID=A0ABS1JZK7_9MICC|nr:MULTISPECIES: hydrogen peroxide-dependent heme synthase [Sinomonas]MBL0704836.1 chlorite dismutase family protein [Sinomonas cellulolyticus]GHG47347.1 chlorite dismutase [Sinomonas sp. KCTC 49339]
MSHTSVDSVTKSAGSGEAAETYFFTLWTVFCRVPGAPAPADSAVSEFEALVARLAEGGVTLRGAYDVSAMRADADVMVWLHGPQAEALQQAVRDIRRTGLFAETEIAWSAMGVHREAEFAKDHTPAFSRGVEPSTWLTVYPFVRSYEWYLLPAEERSRMLRDHGILGRDFPQVLSNTVSAFALGDWEWILALEAPQLTDLVDMMRHLRYTDARTHVREEVPFYTGRRISAAEIAEVLA